MKKNKKIVKNEVYHLLMYVEDSNPKIKRFDSTDKMGKFIDDFNKKYPESEAGESGFWTDFCVTGITGDVHFFTDGLQVE